jgi:carbamoyl-phosphate synthase large subunit
MIRNKILITSVGSMVGWSLLNSLAHQRDKYTIIGTNSSPESPNLYACDKAYLVPETRDEKNYEKKLTQILMSENPEIVIPGRDAELKCLANLSIDPRFENTFFLATAPRLVKLFDDKYETFCFARDQKLPFAKSAFTLEEVERLVHDFDFPIVAKPRWGGHASKDTWIVNDWKAVHQLLKTGHHLFQEFIFAESLGKQTEGVFDRGVPLKFEIQDVRHAAEMVIGRSGEVVSLSMVISNTMGALSQNMVAIEDSDMRKIVNTYALVISALGHRGILNLQGKKDPNGCFIPFELNARLTGSCAARTMLGYNQVLHAISHFLDNKGPWADHVAQATVKIFRTPIYQSVNRIHINNLTANKIWKAP